VIESIDIPSIDMPALPKGWGYQTVGELGATGEQSVLTGPFGTNLGRSDFVDAGVPLLTIGCLTEGGINLDKALFVSESKAAELLRYRLKEGDLLFSRMASVGRAGLVPKRLEGALFNYHIMRLRLNTVKIDARLFINYVRGAAQVRNYLKAVNHGATRDGINTDQLLGLPVAVPPIEDQRDIVAEIDKQFSRLDEAVANLQRVKANLKRYKASVLKAAVEGRLVPSEGSWVKAKLGDIALSVRNGYSQKPDAEFGNRIFRISAVRPMELNVDDVRHLSGQSTDYEAFRATAGDVLFTRYNGSRDYVGVCAEVPEGLPPTIYPDKLIRVRVPKSILLPGFLVIAASTGPGRASIEMMIRTTAGQSGVSGSDIKAIPLEIPTIQEQQRILTEVDARLSTVRVVANEVDADLKRAQGLRQATLQKLFTTNI
jgi:type I restriction enzyme, S subunit